MTPVQLQRLVAPLLASKYSQGRAHMLCHNPFSGPREGREGSRALLWFRGSRPIVKRGHNPTLSSLSPFPSQEHWLPSETCLWPASEPGHTFWKPLTLDLGGCYLESKRYLSCLGGRVKKAEASEVINQCCTEWTSQ